MLYRLQNARVARENHSGTEKMEPYKRDGIQQTEKRDPSEEKDVSTQRRSEKKNIEPGEAIFGVSGKGREGFKHFTRIDETNILVSLSLSLFTNV